VSADEPGSFRSTPYISPRLTIQSLLMDPTPHQLLVVMISLETSLRALRLYIQRQVSVQFLDHHIQDHRLSRSHLHSVLQYRQVPPSRMGIHDSGHHFSLRHRPNLLLLSERQNHTREVQIRRRDRRGEKEGSWLETFYGWREADGSDWTLITHLLGVCITTGSEAQVSQTVTPRKADAGTGAGEGQALCHVTSRKGNKHHGSLSPCDHGCQCTNVPVCHCTTNLLCM
jgi:hypothetical protein